MFKTTMTVAFVVIALSACGGSERPPRGDIVLNATVGKDATASSYPAPDRTDSPDTVANRDLLVPDVAPDKRANTPPPCPIYVDGDAIDAGVETGAATSPWKTIKDAIDHATKWCNSIIVKRGTYREQIFFGINNNFHGTLKSEEGAGVTVIDPSGTDDYPVGIFLVDHGDITIEGFTIANAEVGINVYSVPYTTIIQHNILLHNKTGISVYYGPENGEPVIIRNNIIIGRPNVTTRPYDGTGIGQRASGGRRCIENNLIISSRGTSNTSAGVFIDISDNWAGGYVQNNIIADGYNGILRYYHYNTMEIQYNCLSGNTHDYAEYAATGTGDLSVNPMFVNPGNGDAGAAADYHLLPDSPCRNAGNPNPKFNDPDGTRNDIGPYGGPFGAW